MADGEKLRWPGTFPGKIPITERTSEKPTSTVNTTLLRRSSPLSQAAVCQFYFQQLPADSSYWSGPKPMFMWVREGRLPVVIYEASLVALLCQRLCKGLKTSKQDAPPIGWRESVSVSIFAVEMWPYIKLVKFIVQKKKEKNAIMTPQADKNGWKCEMEGSLTSSESLKELRVRKEGSFGSLELFIQQNKELSSSSEGEKKINFCNSNLDQKNPLTCSHGLPNSTWFWYILLQVWCFGEYLHRVFLFFFYTTFM